MLRKNAPLALKEATSDTLSDLKQLWQDADQVKTITEWMEGVCNVHQYRDDTRNCEDAVAALEEAIHQIGVAAGHIEKLMRREP